MKPINYDYEPLNEYTTPLPGEPDYTNAGVIKVVGRYGEKYAIAKIEYQTFFNEEYQYIFTPYWDVIDGLDNTIFQGIPGITMELRLEKYYRVNMQPVFITERSPSKNREDLWELLESVGLDYYDRFEWLIRTELTCGNDNLIVERYREEPREFDYPEASSELDLLQRSDKVTIESQSSISEHPAVYAEKLLKLLATGADVSFQVEQMQIDRSNRDTIMMILRQQFYSNQILQKKIHQKGIDAARERGEYRGRKKIAVDREKLQQIKTLFHEKKITEKQAMERLGIPSRSTFYRRLKEL